MGQGELCLQYYLCLQSPPLSRNDFKKQANRRTLATQMTKKKKKGKFAFPSCPFSEYVCVYINLRVGGAWRDRNCLQSQKSVTRHHRHKIKRKEILVYRLGPCFKQELGTFFTTVRNSWETDIKNNRKYVWCVFHTVENCVEVLSLLIPAHWAPGDSSAWWVFKTSWESAGAFMDKIKFVVEPCECHSFVVLKWGILFSYYNKFLNF